MSAVLLRDRWAISAVVLLAAAAGVAYVALGVPTRELLPAGRPPVDPPPSV